MGKTILIIAAIVVALIAVSAAIKFLWKQLISFVVWFCENTTCILCAGVALFVTGTVLLFWERYREQGIYVMLWAALTIGCVLARKITLKKYGILDRMSDVSTSSSFLYLIGMVFLALGAIGAIIGVVGVERILRITYEEADMVGRIVSENPLRVFKNIDLMLANVGYTFVKKIAIAFGFISMSMAMDLIDIFCGTRKSDDTVSVVCWAVGALIAAVLLTKPTLKMINSQTEWMYAIGMFISLFAFLALFVQFPRKAMRQSIWLCLLLAVGAVIISVYCASIIFWYIAGIIILIVLYIGMLIFGVGASVADAVIEERYKYKKRDIEQIADADASRLSDYDLHWYYLEHAKTADSMDPTWEKIRKEYEKREL